ncbi:MAG: hypothetical protein U1D55_08875 [Phycisphaerae bacterium]
MEYWFNLIECGVWVTIGVCTFVTPSIRRRLGSRASIVASTLVVFGVSDLVEAHTGAWWRPWWLLTWKAACLAVLALTIWPAVRQRDGASGR